MARLRLWLCLSMLLVASSAAAASFQQTGGTRVRLFVDASVPDADAKKAAQDSVEVLERRLDNMGWSGAAVRPEGARDLVVEVPGLQDRTIVGEICTIPSKLAFRFAAQEGEKGRLVPQADGSPAMRVVEQPIVTEADVLDAQPGADPATETPTVNIRLTSDAAARFGKATAANIGRAVAIVVDGQILSAPRILTPINGGALQIVGAMTAQGARRLALFLRSGPLPATLHVRSTEVVPPQK